MQSDSQTSAENDVCFFWGHTPRRAGTIDQSCLSQWYPANFSIQGIQFQTAEHWMMYSKAALFDDAEMQAAVLLAETPKAAKALGRRVRNFESELWELRRLDLVTAGNLAKFRQNQQLADYLLSTGNALLVEASPVDLIWGIGLAQNHPDAGQPAKWRGMNLLGQALMTVRSILKLTI